MTLLVRRALAAAATTAAVLALAGCGGDDSGDGDAAKEPASSSSSTAAAEGSDTPAAEESEDTSTGGGSAPAEGEEISGDQFADILKTSLDQATTAHIVMDLGAQGRAEGDADYTADPPELAMTMSIEGLGGDIEVRSVGGTFYLRSEQLSGDKWISFSLDDPNSPFGALGGQLDVTKQLETFGAAVTSAVYDGTEDVDGESLDHYTATVDTEKLLQNLPGGAGQAGGQMPDTVTQEWWFDGEGFLRRFTLDMAGTTVDASMSEWGEDVEIDAPPSDQVTTMPGAQG